MRLKYVALALFTIGIVGCKEVKIKDGRVPEAYLEQAKTIEGKFFGHFDGKRAEVEIIFDGDKPIVHYTDAFGTDLLDQNCNSKIDLLKTVYLYKKNGAYQLDQADFGFHPGTCRQVRGRILSLDFSGQNKFSASIYDYSDYVQRCSPGGPPNFGNNCNLQEVQHFLTGEFSR